MKCLVMWHQTVCSNKQGDLGLPLLCWIMLPSLGRAVDDRMFSTMMIMVMAMIVVMTVVLMVVVVVMMVLLLLLVMVMLVVW